jgi:hypothetical protein
MTKIFLISTVIVLIGTACTKESNSEALAPKAVVESYLIAGERIEVKVSEESVTGTIDSLQPISGLSVVVTSNGTSYPLSETGEGVYSHPSLTAMAGQHYTLHFEYNNKEITAETTVPDQPMGFTASATTITPPSPPTPGTTPVMPDPVVYTWDNPYNDYHLMVVKCIETNPVEINSGVVLVGGRVFRNEPTQNSTQNLRPMQFTYYGLHEVILYRILPEYAALYEDNGDNSNNLTAPPGNITNGLGIFTGVHYADKLYITVQ